MARVPTILRRPLVSSAWHIAAAMMIALAATANAVAAIPGIPAIDAAPKTAVAKPAAPDQRTQTQEQLAEARRQLEFEAGGTTGADSPAAREPIHSM